MSQEIGEILAKLKEKEVFDLKDRVPIILIDRSESRVDFSKTPVLEVKRFISLINHHLAALTYLSRNPSFENLTQDVGRSDRVMGAINYGKTIEHRIRNYTGENTVFCSEVIRSYNTPENMILAIVLFSIMMYCDKYLKLSQELIRTINSRFDPTIEELQKIRTFVTNLLSVRSIRQLLPQSLDTANDLDFLLTKMRIRIQQGKIPEHYAKVLLLFKMWRHSVFVSSKEEEIAKDVLHYHFMSLTDANDLYECWLFCKILYSISQIYDIKFKESNSSTGLVKFKANDGSFHILYQPRFQTEWIDQDRFIEDKPDILIEFKNGNSMIIDAKNSYYSTTRPRPYFNQMRSYMKTLNSRYGVFIHSESEDSSLWREVYSNTSGQKIIWTTISPILFDNKFKDNLSKVLTLQNELLWDK